MTTTTLKDRLRTDLTAAIKGRDELRAAALRMALSAITNEESRVPRHARSPTPRPSR